MDLHQLLNEQAEAILTEAEEAVRCSQLRSYRKAGSDVTRQRLRALYDLTVRASRERNLAPMIAHAEAIAAERFESGFDLWEVQTAFSVLEQAIWARVLKQLPPESFAESLGLVSTVLGVGKDTVARLYVSLASKTRVQTLNLQSLFSGTT